jgi:hypothetical protein
LNGDGDGGVAPGESAAQICAGKHAVFHDDEERNAPHPVARTSGFISLRRSRRNNSGCRQRRKRDGDDLPSWPANRRSDRDDECDERQRVGESGEETGDVRGERICDERHDAPSVHSLALMPLII